MRNLIILIVALAMLVWWFKNPSIDARQAQVSFDYIVKYSGEADSSATLPMLIALHGNGDSPDNFFATALNQITIPARIILIKAPVSMGRGTAWPMDSAGLKRYGSAIAEIVPRLTNRYPTRKQAALFGFSGGGVMAYYLSAVHPEQFSYIFPVSGKLTKENLQGIPSRHNDHPDVFAFHGVQDTVIAISGGRMAYQLLLNRGARISLQEFQGGHLGVFTNMKAEISHLLDEKLKSLRYGP